MRAHLVVGRIWGIEIGLHASWLVLAALVVSSLAGHFSATAPQWGPRLIWTTAGVTAALVFVSLVLHELAHAAVARSRGLPVPSITLFALGGMAQIKQEAGDPKTEFWMGLAGPATSGAIGFCAFAAIQAFGPQAGPRPATELLAWVGAINTALAAFNLIPGFPLDGGRLLRAAVWGWTGDFMRATRLASRAGQAVAIAFLAYGAGRVLTGAGLGGLWIALLGWFLLEASTATYAQAEMRRLLSGMSAGALMARDPAMIEARVPLSAFIDDSLLQDVRSCFVACEDQRPVGLVTAREVARVPREAWSDTRVSDVMRRLQDFPCVAADTPAAEALEIMGRDNAFYLPVSRDGALEGVVSRADILQALNTRRIL